MAGNLGPDMTGGTAGALIKDTETAAFGPDVVAESHKQPVLVHFWSPSSESSKQLIPVLERTVKAAKGKVKLVKMDIEAHPQIPERLGVHAVPAVIVFQKAQPIDGFMGSLPETQIRGFLERLVGPIEAPVDLLTEAETLLAEEDATGAAEIFAAILKEDPTEFKAMGGLIRAFLAAGQLEGARRILSSVPAIGERDLAIVTAKAAVELAEQAAALGDFADFEKAIAANPADYQARFDLAIALNGQGQRDAAADQLLEIIRLDRTWNDDAARKQLLQFFDAWSLMDPATLTARRKLSSLLFS